MDERPLAHDCAFGSEAIRLVLVPGHPYGIAPAGLGFAFLVVCGLWLLAFLGAGIYEVERASAALCAFGAVLLGAFWVTTRLVIRRLRNQGRWELIEEPEVNSGTARLVCYGDAIELRRVRALNGHMSDPYIAMRILPAINARTAVVIAGVCLAGALLIATVPGPMGTHFVLPGLVVAVLYVYPKLLPEYYRVSSGRIELLKFPVFGSRGCVPESVDLTRARVICRYDQRRLEIAGQDGKGKTMAIDLWALSAPHEFAEAVFRGCLCTTQAPRLPKGELLG